MHIRRKVTYISISLVVIVGLVALLRLVSQERYGLTLSHNQVVGLSKACQSGDAEACWALHLYYIEDKKSEASWLQKAADFGDLRAQYYLSSRLKSNRDDESREKALDLINKAAIQNYPTAQGVLARWYRDGIIVEKNIEVSEYWLRKAANNGLISAMIDLSHLLIDRRGDRAALDEAYMWTAIVLMRVDGTSGFAAEARQLQVTIVKRATEKRFDAAKLKSNCELKAVELEKQIPVEIDAIKDQKILMENIQRKYGD